MTVVSRSLSSSFSQSSSAAASPTSSSISSHPSLANTETPQQKKKRLVDAKRNIMDCIYVLSSALEPIPVPALTSTNRKQRYTIMRQNIELKQIVLIPLIRRLNAWQENLSPEERALLAPTPEQIAHNQRAWDEFYDDVSWH